MQLDAWTTSSSTIDHARRKRLTIGYGIGAITVGIALSLITYSAHGQVFEQEEAIDVSLASAPVVVDEAEPEPEPEPPKPPPQRKKAHKHKLSVATPTGVPDTVPDEANPNKDPYDGDLDDVFDGEGGGGSQQRQRPPVVVRKKQVPAPAPAPVLVSEREHSKPPVPLSQPRPAYPAEARSEGVEGTVVVQFLVTENGSVGDVRVVRGDSRLCPAVVAVVKRWRFEPGTFQGRPVAVWRTASFPFRLKA